MALTVYEREISGDEVDWLHGTIYITKAGCDWCISILPLFRRMVVPSAVRCCTVFLLLCFLIVGIHASGISIPLSLLILLGWSPMWIASFTLSGYQGDLDQYTWPARSKLDSGWTRGRVQKRQRPGYWGGRLSLTGSLILSYIGLPVSPM